MKPLQDFELAAYVGMKVIDAHMHLPEYVSIDYLLQVMDKYHIEKAIVIPLHFNGFSMDRVYFESMKNNKSSDYINNVLRQLVLINKSFLKKVKTCPNRISAAAWVSPECEGMEEIISLPEVDEGKFIPSLDESGQSSKKYAEKISPLVERLVSEDKRVGIHTGWLARPKIIEILAKKFKEGTFIMRHAKEDNDSFKFERYEVMNECPNMLLEVSYYQLAKRISDFAKKFGTRLLFGSDYINKGYECNISHQLLGIKLADITKQQQEDILYNNAAKLFSAGLK